MVINLMVNWAGRPNLTYIDLLNQDTGLEEPDTKNSNTDGPLEGHYSLS